MSDDDTTAIRRPCMSSAPGVTTPSLVELSGSSIGRLHRLDRPKLVIGRSADCDIRLHDEGISRRHIRITEYERNVTLLEDLNSKNGTFVNGEPVKRRALCDGDRIHIGSTTILKFSLQDELEGKLQQRLYDAAVRDVLTHTYNRRFFEEELSRAFTHALRHRQPLSLLLLDIDHFKRVNDELGHAAGDRVLMETAARCAGTIRNEDVLCRIGGEEFGIIARSTTAHNAAALAERLRGRVGKTPICLPQGDITVTVSIGAAELDPLIHHDIDELCADVDRLLYEAKRAGRNRVCSPQLSTSC